MPATPSALARGLRAIALAALAGSAGLPVAQAQLAFELISAAEAKAEGEAHAVRAKEGPGTFGDEGVAPRTRGAAAAAAPAAPNRPVFGIRVLAPVSQGAVPAPLRIELAFEPLPGARVVPASFRILYGVLKIDLTDRLRRFATITESGVVVDQAVVPEGVHRLFVQVGDDKGNVAEQELRLRVGARS